MGKATVSFGMVSIPIKVYTSSNSQGSVSFNMLHGKCGSRIRQQLYCPTDDEVVERSEIVKGYEFAKDQYVTFEPEELKALEAVSTNTIEITEFIPADQIDPVYFSKAYYLSPDMGGDRAYSLLSAAMRETGRVGLARYAARGKEYLVMLRAMEGALVMQQLRYVEEVKAITEIPLPETEVKESELKLAVQLIDQVSSEEFHPENYQDSVTGSIRELVQKKVEGQEVIAVTPEQPQAQIIDLMDALKASLGDAPSPSSQSERKSAKRATAQLERRTAKAN